MNEKLIERKLRQGVEKLGGMALKLMSLWFTGMPDRTVLLPGGRIYFVELKSTGKKQSPRQKIVKALLQRLGFTFYVIDDQAGLDAFFNDINPLG